MMYFYKKKIITFIFLLIYLHSLEFLFARDQPPAYFHDDIRLSTHLIKESMTLREYSEAMDVIRKLLEKHRYGSLENQWIGEWVFNFLNDSPEDFQQLWSATWADEIHSFILSHSFDPLILYKAILHEKKDLVWQRFLASLEEKGHLSGLVEAYYLANLLGQDPQSVFEKIKRQSKQKQSRAHVYWLEKVLGKKLEVVPMSRMVTSQRFSPGRGDIGNMKWQRPIDRARKSQISFDRPLLFTGEFEPKESHSLVKILEEKRHLQLSAFDLTTGERRWTKEFPNKKGECFYFESAATSLRSVDVLSWHRPGTSQYITSLSCRKDSRELIWETSLSQLLQRDHVLPGSEPFLSPDTLYMTLFSLKGYDVYGGSLEYSLLAVDAATGTLKWELPLNHLKLSAKRQFPISELCLEENILYLTAGFGRLFAIDSQEGFVLWESDVRKNKFRDLRKLERETEVIDLGIYYAPPQQAGSEYSEGVLLPFEDFLVTRVPFGEKLLFVSKVTGEEVFSMDLKEAKLLSGTGGELVFACPQGFAFLRGLQSKKPTLIFSVADFPYPARHVTPWHGGALASKGKNLFHISQLNSHRRVLQRSLKKTDYFYFRDSLIGYSSGALMCWEVSEQDIEKQNEILEDRENKKWPPTISEKRLLSWAQKNQKKELHLDYSATVQTKEIWDYAIQNIYLNTEKRLWTADPELPGIPFEGQIISIGIESFLTVTQNKLHFYQVDQESGVELRWSSSYQSHLKDSDLFNVSYPPEALEPSALILGDLVFINKGNWLRCLEAASGKDLWEREFDVPINLKQVFYSAKTLFFSLEIPGVTLKIYALNVLTGRLTWMSQLNLSAENKGLEIPIVNRPQELWVLVGSAWTTINKKSGLQEFVNLSGPSDSQQKQSLQYLGGHESLVFQSKANEVIIYSKEGRLQKTFACSGPVIFLDHLAVFFDDRDRQLFIYDLKSQKKSEILSVPVVGQLKQMLAKGQDLYLLSQPRRDSINRLWQINLMTKDVREINSSEGPNISELFDGGSFVGARGVQNHYFLYSD